MNIHHHALLLGLSVILNFLPLTTMAVGHPAHVSPELQLRKLQELAGFSVKQWCAIALMSRELLLTWNIIIARHCFTPKPAT